MASIFTEKEILKKFFEVHGSLYDYSLVNYKNMNEKVKIICNSHKDFKSEEELQNILEDLISISL